MQYYQKSIIASLHDYNNSDIFTNPHLKNIISMPNLLKAIHGKANAFMQLYELKTHAFKDLVFALETYNLTDQLIEKMNREYNYQETKFSFAEKTSEIYFNGAKTSLLLFSLTQDRQDLDKAFLFAEKNKATLLQQSLTESQALTYADIPDSLKEKEKSLKIDLTFYEKMLFEEQAKKEDGDSAKIALWQDMLFSLKREHEQLIQTLEEDYPDYYTLKYQTYTISPREIQENILDDQSAMVEYFMGDSSLIIFAITQDTTVVREVKLQAAFQDTVQLCIDAIKNKEYHAYTTAAYALHQKLISPVEEIIKCKNLIIIPDGMLGYLSFESLLTEKPEQKKKNYQTLPYLIKKHQITYAYSATLYAENLKSKNNKFQYAGFAPVSFQ